jgi:hypothetical protein
MWQQNHFASVDKQLTVAVLLILRQLVLLGELQGYIWANDVYTSQN